MGRILNMEIYFNQDVAINYKSTPQKIRVMSELWAKNNMYCPCCGNSILTKFENNKPVADFYCRNCGEIFELKSKNGNIGRKINDGAYETAIKRISSNENPNLFVLQYNKYKVVNFQIIPKYFFTPEIIESRKPLSLTAKRAGWKGCNIVYGNIPIQGKIFIIKDQIIQDKRLVVNEFKESNKLYINNIQKRGWLLDTLFCINLLKKDIFTLNDMYKFENKLKEKYEKNNNIKPKIRQQL